MTAPGTSGTSGTTGTTGMPTDSVVERGRDTMRGVADRGVKPGAMTSEFISSMIAAIGILVAAAVSDNFQADEAWPWIALLSIGYMISRGLAKLGASWGGRRDF